MRFDFDSATRRKLGYRLIDHVDKYFSSLADRKVQLPDDERTYGALDHSLPETGEDPIMVLDSVCREMINKGFHVPAANYFGLMNPTPTYMGFLAEALVAALNPQLATLARPQLASKIELETIRWMAERVGWNKDFGGTSPAEETKPISADWHWRWHRRFPVRSRKGFHPSLASRLPTLRPNRIIHWTNPRACLESDASGCSAFR
jgi:hypothetical protein